MTFEKGSIFLINLKDEKMIIAEYDLDDYVEDDAYLTMNLEPIYNSPVGLQLNDLLLLVLTTYSLDVWHEMLKAEVVPISETDYSELNRRLKL